MFTLFRHEVDASEEDLIEVEVVEFVLAVGDAAQSFGAIEVAFNRIACAIADVAERPRLAAIRLRRRDQLLAEFSGRSVSR